MFMVDRLLDAARELPTATPSELFDRFVAWTRTSRTT
jgi:hypothetical protein